VFLALAGIQAADIQIAKDSKNKSTYINQYSSRGTYLTTEENNCASF
jgi:hypothetical protein